MSKNKGITIIEVIVVALILITLGGLISVILMKPIGEGNTAISEQNYDSSITFYGADFIKLYEAKYGKNAILNKEQLENSYFFYQNGKRAK